VWGDPSNTCEVFLNGVSRQVTVSLASALQHLRDKEKEFVLTDAICINQENLDERSKQVQFVMDEVFRDAEEVVVWLGEGSNYSELALDLIESWAKWNEHESSDGGDLLRVDRDLQLALDSSVGSAAETALKRLLQGPFWTRLWVLQEVVLAQKVLIVCGHRRVPFESFVRARST
jgi:hypothetical protein